MASNASGFDALLNSIFSSPWAPTNGPAPHTAESCLRRAVNGLAADNDPVSRALGEALEGSTIRTGPTGDHSLMASVAVQGSKLTQVRDNMTLLRYELEGQFAHEGWRLTELNVVAAESARTGPTAPPKKHELASGLAESIASLIKAYDVAAVCDHLGMPPHPDPDADPFKSKRIYVQSRLHTFDVEQIAAAARRFLEDYDDEALEALLDRHRRGGHYGTIKNLVFGSTEKPDLVLLDALSNDLGLVNPQAALLYDAGIPEEGLSWKALITDVLPRDASTDLRAAGLALYRRLQRCLASDAERNFFRLYAQRYKSFGFDQPALIPQVWLHYDPKCAWQRDGEMPLMRQRMDFLLLLAGRRRVVVEVDGIEHYSEKGQPSPSRYADMVRADRDLRLAGYEVYRFGGVELLNFDNARVTVTAFLDELLK